MNKTEKISELKTSKSRKVSFLFNDELWTLFKKACNNNKTKPTWEVEKWILNYLDKNNLLDE
ncbi:MAG: plasmid partition protein ParG [Candidatus Gastranaerophilales bacterium]